MLIASFLHLWQVLPSVCNGMAYSDHFIVVGSWSSTGKGPWYYSVYHWLPTYPEIIILTYADDTAILFSHWTISVQKLELHLNKIDLWYKEWCTKINVEKWQNNIITLRSQSCFIISFKNTLLFISNTARCLGFCSNLPGNP